MRNCQRLLIGRQQVPFLLSTCPFCNSSQVRILAFLRCTDPDVRRCALARCTSPSPPSRLRVSRSSCS